MMTTSSTADLTNLEGLDEYAVNYPWSRRGQLTPGTTAVIRARNEAHNMPWVLPPLFRTVQDVILIDNLSDDGTAEVAREVATQHDAGERLRVHNYPFEVSRCGSEHLQTSPRSVHSLTWFYDWSFSHVESRYALKWDGDMVLSSDVEGLLADLSWMLPGQDVVLTIPRHSLYIADESLGYFDLGQWNNEHFGYPVSAEYRYTKAFEWETRMHPPSITTQRLPKGASVELKWLDSDEFDHWTTPEAFGTSARTLRKKREWQLFADLRAENLKPHPDVHAIEAPSGVHVIDHVVNDWLPDASRSMMPGPG